ncbi:unnamed protein product [Owenia fusiformis]|uniref:guanylate cyclase n=1 Tax=Owenia fusiformis TaxID=6347 RepID=A0A8S4N0E0_OWEFU|nr:unnamed protein product [Owenia fusiformis]
MLSRKMDSSSTPSLNSLNSQELLRIAWRDLLKQSGHTSGLCRGDPITTAGKRRQIVKMVTLVLIPIAGLLGLSLFVLGDSISSKQATAELRTNIEFSIEVGRFIHQLQKERDMSVLYFSQLGPETKSFLLNFYPQTDDTLDALSQWPVRQRNTLEQFRNKKSFRFYLAKHRNELDLLHLSDKNYTYVNEIQFYSSMIDVFLLWLQDAIQESRYGTMWRTLVAYMKIIAAKEDVGIERSFGGAFYVRGGFLFDDDFFKFNRQLVNADVKYAAAKTFSPLVDSIRMYGINVNGINLATIINNYRDDIQDRNASFRDPSVRKATQYFDDMTVYVNLLLDIQVELANKIFDNLRNKSVLETTSLVMSAILLLIVLTISPVVVQLILKMTNDIQRYAITLASKTQELHKEKKKTDSLLYQMLPRPVADQLKKNKDVNAEYFKEVTIFFSDIVGFTRISLECTPMQIVELLNTLYNTFDKRIELYDVYKVETIGDSYMVASGLPSRNGNKHVYEIANMSLDLMAVTATLELGDITNDKIELRIGIHTGHCVAGVVGIKLPRYCLFGDTVNTASRLETSGLANRIHISTTTHRLLARHGGYTMQQRGVMELKGKGRMNTYWLLGMKFSPNTSPKPGTSTTGAAKVFNFDEPQPGTSGTGGVQKVGIGEPVKPKYAPTGEVFAGQTSSQLPLKHLYEARDGLALPVEGEVPLSLDELDHMFDNNKGSPPIVQLVEGLHF